MNLIRSLTLTGCLAAVALAAGGCGGSDSGRNPALPPGALSAPLDTSFSYSGASFAVVAMGELNQPLNTFWQLLVRPAGKSRWLLVTPPGVADNGGLVVDAPPGARAGAIEVGFRPSVDLAFSPIAATPPNRIAWNAPGLLPGGFDDAPDSFAGGEAGTARFALVATGGGEVLTGTGSSSNWSVIVTRHSLAATLAGRSCGIDVLTALAVASSGEPVVGAACAHPVAGVFVRDGRRWVSAPLRLPVAFGKGATSVLRVTTLPGTNGRLMGLVSGGGSAHQVAAVWGPAGARSGGSTGDWSSSAAFPLGKGARVVTTGFGPQGQVAVAWSTGRGSLRAAVDAGPGRRWQVLSAPPKGTEALVIGRAGSVDALAVSSTLLVDWQLQPRTGRWKAVQRMRVPIELGSSS
jgi:hypothetical protein